MVDEELSFEFLVVNGDTLQVDDIEGRKEGKLITLTTDLAIKYGIADGISESIEEILLLESIENYEIIRIQENWSENLVRLLTNPTVSSLLMTFGTIGIIAELYSAGWGIGGTIGAICLVLALGAGYISKLATSSDLLIVVAGLLLLLIEAFFVAGFGIIGLLGVAILFYGFYLLLIPDIPLDYDTQQQAIDGFGWGVFIGIIGLIYLIRVILRSELFNKLVSLDSNKSNLKENYNNRSKVD